MPIKPCADLALSVAGLTDRHQLTWSWHRLGWSWHRYSLSLVLSCLLCVSCHITAFYSSFSISILTFILFYYLIRIRSRKILPGEKKSIDFSFCCKSRCFACTKRQVRSWTYRDLLFWSKSRCFASKNHRWGLGHIEASISGANHAVLHAQNDRWSLILIETCNSGPKVAVLHAKTTDEGWDG